MLIPLTDYRFPFPFDGNLSDTIHFLPKNVTISFSPPTQTYEHTAADSQVISHMS